MATAKEKKEAELKQAAKGTKFVELAQARTTKAINAVRSIRKLANKNNYAYTEDQTGKICEALRAEILALHEAFNKEPGTKAKGFIL